MLPKAQFERIAAQITSLDTRRHALALYGLVRWLQPASVVEVGTYAGGTAVWLARALQENAEAGAPGGQLYCIDDFSLADTYATLWYNLGACGVGDVVQVYGGSSQEPEAWPKQVDFCFVDGNHSFDGCLADILAAKTRGASCIVVHDIASWWGPRAFYEEFRQSGWSGWTQIAAGHDGGLLVLLKAPVLGPVEWTREAAPSGAAVLPRSETREG